MLERVALDSTVKKSVYKEQKEELTARLTLLQQEAMRAGLPIVVIFEGWGSAGKGSRISDLVVNLDPRLFAVYTTEDPVGYENRLPFMNRFWSKIGKHGTMTIFDQAYYDAVARAIIDESDKKTARKSPEATHSGEKVTSTQLEATTRYERSIRSFELQLAADGYLIVKFFLHISQEEQRARFTNLMLDPNTSFRVTDEDIRQLQRYDDYYRVYDHLLEHTNRTHAPWTLVSSMDRRSAQLTILRTLVTSIEDALKEREKQRKATEAYRIRRKAEIAEAQQALEAAQEGKRARDITKAQSALAYAQIGDASSLTSQYDLVKVRSLDEVKHNLTIDPAEYKERLKAAQTRLSELNKRLFHDRIPLIMVYEGWDAAGKGGNIKRVAAALDARSYIVHPTSAPTSVELEHPFLWRFWTKIPRTGHIAIFDRSWYGRVMVERVEGFATQEEWQRAFDEINDFEADLHQWGAIIVKFWINVSSEEQLNRFTMRAQDPAKQWKLTDEDWRNREKNHLYHQCVNDMLRLTSTSFAPWHIIESDDKKYARVKALELLISQIEQHLQL